MASVIDPVTLEVLWKGKLNKLTKLLVFITKDQSIKLASHLIYYISKVKYMKYEDLFNYLYDPTDPSSIGVIRFLFGLLMTIDIFEERGGSEIDLRWGQSQDCLFPLFSILQPLPYPFMCVLYAIMCIGSLGIMLGYKFKASTICFTIPYWYLLLLDKSFWNNHSYLYGIIGILIIGSSAENFFSVDCILNRHLYNKPVPYWNYFILKYQFFMLYFLAGLKKTDAEWLEGYSVRGLGDHWVFLPFSIILSTEQIDYLVVHWFGFILDLTIGFWMLLDFTRPIAMIFCALFHLMNSRLFSLGMFPYVCLVTMPLFCKEDWPKTLWRNIIHQLDSSKNTFNIEKGYNNWTNGLYGYSWDMMIHSWETVLVVVKVVDNDSGESHFINPNIWTHNDRWTKHGDMCLQYANCIKRNLENHVHDKSKQIVLSKNISIYIDVWCSLNKRFQQRIYDPNYDLIKANWSPFQPVEWLLPVMSEYNDFRRKMDDITRHVHSWNNESDVMFVADFPDMFLENYIGHDLKNVSLTVLDGVVFFEVVIESTRQSVGAKLHTGDSVAVPEGYVHRVHTIGKKPSCYMYTFSKNETNEKTDIPEKTYSPFPLIENFPARKEHFLTMMKLIGNATLHLLFGTPLEIRHRVIRRNSDE